MDFGALKVTLREFCEKHGILYDFDPQADFRAAANGTHVDFYETRSMLLKMENKPYLTHFFDHKTQTLGIFIKTFVLWDDTIDEEESYWVDDKTLCSVEAGAHDTIEDVIARLLDVCNRNKVFAAWSDSDAT